MGRHHTFHLHYWVLPLWTVYTKKFPIQICLLWGCQLFRSCLLARKHLTHSICTHMITIHGCIILEHEHHLTCDVRAAQCDAIVDVRDVLDLRHVDGGTVTGTKMTLRCLVIRIHNNSWKCSYFLTCLSIAWNANLICFERKLLSNTLNPPCTMVLL